MVYIKVVKSSCKQGLYAISLWKKANPKHALQDYIFTSGRIEHTHSAKRTSPLMFYD